MDPDSAQLSSLLVLLQEFLQHPPELPAAALFQLAILLLLLIASAFFSGSEVALFSLDGTAKTDLAEAGDRASTRVLALLERPRQLLVTILVLNTVVNVGAAVLAALLITQVAEALAWPHTWALLIEMVALTFVLLVVSEITPKLLASQDARRFSRTVAIPLFALHRALHPLTRVLTQSMNGVQRLVRSTPVARFSTEDLKTMADVGEAHGTLEEEERDLIHSIVEFGETTVREVMVSRLDMVALPVTTTLPEALRVIRESGHSRLPLYDEHLDNLLGIVYAKDLLPYLDDPTAQVDWRRLARPAMFVPLGKRLDDLLREFQLRKTHLTIVVDEYGGTAGLVTMEDLLEEIVGDIRDEHDDDEDEDVQRIDESTWRVDGRIDLDDLNDLLDLDLDTEAFDFESLGGLIFHLTGAIPSVGDEVVFDRLQMRVDAIENHRIKEVVVHLLDPVDARSGALDEPDA